MKDFWGSEAILGVQIGEPKGAVLRRHGFEAGEDGDFIAIPISTLARRVRGVQLANLPMRFKNKEIAI
jgi:hypothetical protein